MLLQLFMWSHIFPALQQANCKGMRYVCMPMHVDVGGCYCNIMRQTVNGNRHFKMTTLTVLNQKQNQNKIKKKNENTE